MFSKIYSIGRGVFSSVFVGVLFSLVGLQALALLRDTLPQNKNLGDILLQETNPARVTGGLLGLCHAEKPLKYEAEAIRMGPVRFEIVHDRNGRQERLMLNLSPDSKHYFAKETAQDGASKVEVFFYDNEEWRNVETAETMSWTDVLDEVLPPLTQKEVSLKSPGLMQILTAE